MTPRPATHRASRTPTLVVAAAALAGGVLVLVSLTDSLGRAAAAERAAGVLRDSLRAAQREPLRGPEDGAGGGAVGGAEADLRGLAPPVQGFVSRGLAPEIGHFGVDVPLPEGTPVRAVADGRVVLADEARGGGQTLVIGHAGGRVSVYKHNAALLVGAGDSVRAGQAVARSGNTGELTSGPHLHVEVWQGGVPLDLRRLVAPR